MFHTASGRGRDGLRVIGSTFASSKFLTHVDLSRNNLVGSEGISSLCNAAKESVGHDDMAFPSLDQLTLSECNIGSSGMQSLAEIILGGNDGKRRRSKRIQLAISSNPIDSEGCYPLSKLCASPKTGSMLSELRLSECFIADEGINLLARAAKANPCRGLSFLDVSQNSITKDGAKSLAESLLESWPDLVELNLAKNELGSKGVALVTEALFQRSDRPHEHSDILERKNTTLKNLDLTRTNCEIEGAKAALMCGSLTTLRLFDNRLGSIGFRSISSLLEGGHPSIENLDLGGNSADEESVVILLDAISNTGTGGTPSSNLSVLEIGGNKFGEKAMEALQRMKRVWPKLDVAHDKPNTDAGD